MAWRSSGTSNTSLVNNLVRNGLIESSRVREAMLAVDRGNFAPSTPYSDSPQSIGFAATISAPHMHASACEKLLPYLKPGASVLDVGSGSGYLTQIFASLVQPGGRVVGIDHIKELVEFAEANVSKSSVGRILLQSGKLQFVKADGRSGYPPAAPFDAIHVGAAAAEHHAAFVDQLKAPGRLFVPVEDPSTGHQSIWVFDKHEDGTVERHMLFGVRYVPLTDAPI